MTTTAKPCPSGTPSWFTGHWRDWHRGHGCGQDDGKPRSDAAIAEIAQHEANKATGYLTDAELRFLRASHDVGRHAARTCARRAERSTDRREEARRRGVRSQRAHDQALRAAARLLRLRSLREVADLRSSRRRSAPDDVERDQGRSKDPRDDDERERRSLPRRRAVRTRRMRSYMAIVEPGTQRSSGNVEDMTPNEQVAWFLEHHECRGLGGSASRKKGKHR